MRGHMDLPFDMMSGLDALECPPHTCDLQHVASPPPHTHTQATWFCPTATRTSGTCLPSPRASSFRSCWRACPG